MVENNSNKKELDKESPEYKFGYSAGPIGAYVVFGCICALIIGVTLKILQWMLF